VSPAFEPGSFSKEVPMSFGLGALPPFSSLPPIACALASLGALALLATGEVVASAPSELDGAETFSTFHA